MLPLKRPSAHNAQAKAALNGMLATRALVPATVKGGPVYRKAPEPQIPIAPAEALLAVLGQFGEPSWLEPPVPQVQAALVVTDA